MTNYKLTYFDADGGRGEPIRIAFHKAGIEFEDHRISFEEFMKMRDSTRFSVLPELEIDGAAVTQSNAISRYIGKTANLYPKDDLQALYCDEALGAAEDMLHSIVTTFGLEGEALKSAREKLASGRLTTYVRGLGQLLTRGGKYFADNRLTIADLKVFYITRWLCSGMLDHIPTDLVARVAPNLIEHLNRIEKDSIVTGYYESRTATA